MCFYIKTPFIASKIGLGLQPSICICYNRSPIPSRPSKAPRWQERERSSYLLKQQQQQLIVRSFAVSFSLRVWKNPISGWPPKLSFNLSFSLNSGPLHSTAYPTCQLEGLRRISDSHFQNWALYISKTHIYSFCSLLHFIKQQLTFSISHTKKSTITFSL